MTAPVRDRLPGYQTTKTVLAAVVSFAVAAALTRSSSTLIAPLTALLVTQVTVFETLTTSVQRVVAVVAGVLLALLLSEFVELHWWSLAVILIVSFTIGTLLKLDDHSTEVAISAMLVFAVRGSHSTAWARVVETLIGAAVGVVFNLFASPTQVEPAGEAISKLADRIAKLLAAASADLRKDWSHDRATRLLSESRRLRHDVDRTEDVLEDAQRSLRLNPRARKMRATAPSLGAALAVLEYVAVSVRSLMRVLADRTDDDATNQRTLGPGDGGRQALSVLFGQLSDAVRAFAALAVGDVGGATGGDEELNAILDRARETRRRLTDVLAVDAREEPRLWTLHGALLSGIDRILREIDLRADGEAHNVPRSAPPRPRWQSHSARLTGKAVAGMANVARLSGATTRHIGEVGISRRLRKSAGSRASSSSGRPTAIRRWRKL